MSSLDFTKIKKELLFFIRNSDILSTTERNVTTTSATGTFAGASELLISVTNIKNIRSIIVASTTLTYGEDYTYDLDNASGCLISFTTAQTGDYTISYDYGTDKIFLDYPKITLTIKNFPRVAIDIIAVESDFGGLGNVIKNNIRFSIYFYSKNKQDITDYITTLRTKMKAHFKNFYNFNAVKVITNGPMLPFNTDLYKNKIFQQNIDFMSILNYEK